MGRRRATLLAVICLAVLAAVYGTVSRIRQPFYKRRSLSHWVSRVWLYPGEDPTAVEAIRQIGTNGLPWLLRWLQSEPAQPAAKKITSWIIARAPDALTPDALCHWAADNPALCRAENASIAIGVLRAKAEPAVPTLCVLVSDQARSNAAGRAAYALVKIGAPETLPTLAANLTNGHPCRKYFAWLIGQVPALTTNAGPAIPALAQCLHDPDPKVAEAAARTLGSARIEPEITTRALGNYLRIAPSSGGQFVALDGLASFGTQARSQAPEVVRFLTNTHLGLRQSATNVLLQIAPEALANLHMQ